MNQKWKTCVPAAFGLFVLILDTKTALLGASEGIALCILTVIPSLFPFLVLSLLLTSGLTGEKTPFVQPLGRLCGIPRGAESLLLVGILGGYPAGAQCIVQAYRDGALSRQNAERMLAFCNLAGPAFLFGIIANKFSDSYAPWLLWGIHISSAIFVSTVLPPGENGTARLPASKALSFTEALQQSVKTLANICGWIVLFRMILTFLERWVLWLLPTTAQVTIAGVLELSNGCCNLHMIGNEGARLVICAGILAFGGLCVTMQTATVSHGLSLKKYLIGKFLQAAISVILAILVQFALFGQTIWKPISALSVVFIAILAVIITIFLHKKQKSSSISQPLVV